MLGRVVIVSCLALGTIGFTAAPAIAAVSKSDRQLIEKQKVCPVSGAKLGAMGEPVKVTAKGRTVFLCCAGCKKKFLADPDKYFQKLDKLNEKPSDKKK